MASIGATTTFELRNPRSSEQTQAAMASLLSVLPAPERGVLKLHKRAPQIVLEFLNFNQTIHALLTTPSELSDFAASQMVSSYPEVRVDKFEESLDEKLRIESAVLLGSELRYRAPSSFPLKTTIESGAPDPLGSVLSVLSKLKQDESALLQFTIRRDRERWKGRHSIRSTHQNQLTVVKADPLVEGKLNLPSFQWSLRIVASTPSRERTKQIVRELASAYSSFDSPMNGLVVRSPVLMKRFINQTLNRTIRVRNQYLSTEEVAALFHLPNKSMSAIKNITWGKNLLGEPPTNLPSFSTTPESERDNVNFFAHTEFKNVDQVFGIKRMDRRRHMYVVGKSGTGKSTLLANMIIHDFKHNEGLAVIDPHGDLIETVLNYIPKHRINDVIVFDPSDPQAVVKLNLFEEGSMVHRELIASGIVSIFQKMYGPISWGPRLEYILRNTLLTLLSQHAKLEDVVRMLTDAQFRAQVVETLPDPVLKNFWTSEFNMMQDRQRNEAIAPILNKVGQFVTSPLIRNVVNVQQSSFDIEKVMDEGKILLINVSQGKLGEDNASLLGALMITKIQLAAMNRVYVPEEKRKDFYLYIDEFQNFATTSFIKILSEARKYRLNLILANQYMDQVPDDVQAAIFGNAGTIASFVLGASDAERMRKEFGNAYSDEDLVSLAKHQIIVKLMIDGQMSLPFPAYTLALAQSSNQSKDTVIRVSRERYSRKK